MHAGVTRGDGARANGHAFDRWLTGVVRLGRPAKHSACAPLDLTAAGWHRGRILLGVLGGRHLDYLRHLTYQEELCPTGRPFGFGVTDPIGPGSVRVDCEPPCSPLWAVPGLRGSRANHSHHRPVPQRGASDLPTGPVCTRTVRLRRSRSGGLRLSRG